MMPTVFVAYPGNDATRFDRAYYVAKHLPLVMDAWGQYGLRSATAFYPEGGGGFIALCLCVFLSDEAVKASFASERTREVMDDISNFTDAKPSQWRAVPLRQ